jgi:predicted kinase
MNYKASFIYWYYNEFQLTDLYLNMSKTVEGSPWHRERNVATHTDMVVSQYIGFAPTEWSHDDMLGAFACAFHDVGKPASCQLKFKKERGGEYKSFGGHEQKSSRMWEDWAATNFSRLWDEFDFVSFDLYVVGWIIEKHLPWGLKKKEKRHNLALTALRIFDWAPRPFTNVLLADTYGRISDDYIEKREKVHAWIEEFEELVESVEASTPEHPVINEIKTLYMPIAASGSGKSTFINDLAQHAENRGEEFDVFSWDALRLEWYIDSGERLISIQDTYRLAFERQCEDKDFMNKANKRFIEMVKTGNTLVVDNTNLSKKRRRFFIDQARRHGYRVRAILLPISLDEVVARQTTRTDKNVPIEAVKQHYNAIQLPEYGEVDDVWSIGDNMQMS